MKKLILLFALMAPSAFGQQAQRLDFRAVRLDGGAGGNSISGTGVANQCTFWGTATTLKGDTGCTVSGTGSTFTIITNNLRLMNAVGNGSTQLTSASSGTAVTFALPNADGSANQCWGTDGSANIGFKNCTIGSGLTSGTVLVGGGGTAVGLIGNQTARTVYGNATSAAAAPGFGTTSDVLAYQTAEIASNVHVGASAFTTTSGTLTPITGLSWSMPGSTPLNIPFSCSIVYKTSASSTIAFGAQSTVTAPTNLMMNAVMNTTASAFTAGIAAISNTSATSVVSAAVATTATDFITRIDGFLEFPSGTASTINIMADTSAGTLTVERGSFCRVGF